jgi:hypothetical protein
MGVKTNLKLNIFDVFVVTVNPTYNGTYRLSCGHVYFFSTIKVKMIRPMSRVKFYNEVGKLIESFLVLKKFKRKIANFTP